jgi:pimeloyl-ACP methyl ester carboxylesterase
MAADVERFIRDHNLTAPTLIGHSMGAKTAMTLALRSPDLIADIIAVDNAPVDATLGSEFAKYVRGMREIEAAEVQRQSEADKILSKYEEALPVRQFLLGNLHRPCVGSPQKFRVPLEILGKALDQMGAFPYTDPREVRFEKPSLFVRGTHSKYVPDEVLPLVGQFFPRFELADIEAGHWVISEKPEEFRQGKFVMQSRLAELSANVLSQLLFDFWRPRTTRRESGSYREVWLRSWKDCIYPRSPSSPQSIA